MMTNEPTEWRSLTMTNDPTECKHWRRHIKSCVLVRRSLQKQYVQVTYHCPKCGKTWKEPNDDEMMNKIIVTKSTEAGKNCGACVFKGIDLEYIDHEDIPFIYCSLPLIDVEWDKDGSPKKGTEHPPGDSWCPEFERME